jgi:hypothetical protein
VFWTPEGIGTNPAEGTYGGHLELSAFAHLKRRNVKVIQPGLVYVIEWDGGESKGTSKDSKRWKGKSKETDPSGEEEEEGAVYIAYFRFFFLSMNL